MEWNRFLLIGCTCALAALIAYENSSYRHSPANLETSKKDLPVALGYSTNKPIAAQERTLNRGRRAQEESVTYPFYTISPRYYYQNSPYHQSRYSYYNGFRYFYPNYDPPTYYYGSPFSIGLGLQFDQPAGEETPTTLTPE